MNYEKVINFINSKDTFQLREIYGLFEPEDLKIHKTKIDTFLKRIRRAGYIDSSGTNTNLRKYILPLDITQHAISAVVVTVKYNNKVGYLCEKDDKCFVDFKSDPIGKKVFESEFLANRFIRKVKQKELYEFGIIKP